MDVIYRNEHAVVTTTESEVEKAASVSLSSVVKREVNRLLANVQDESNFNLYTNVITQMDAGIIEALIEYTKNNQSMATRILGLARGTVRKKWSIYTKAKQEENKLME